MKRKDQILNAKIYYIDSEVLHNNRDIGGIMLFDTT